MRFVTGSNPLLARVFVSSLLNGFQTNIVSGLCRVSNNLTSKLSRGSIFNRFNDLKQQITKESAGIDAVQVQDVGQPAYSGNLVMSSFDNRQGGSFQSHLRRFTREKY